MKEKTEFFDCLQVTQVHVFPFKDTGNLGHIKGIASVVLNDQLVIRGIRIMEGEHGLFIGFPVDPFFRGEDLRSIVSPTTQVLHEHIENCVLEKYDHVTHEDQPDDGNESDQI